MIGKWLRIRRISGGVIGVIAGGNRWGRGELAGDGSRVVGLIGRSRARVRVRVLKLRLIILLVIGRANVAVLHIGILITDWGKERFERRLAD